MDSGLLSLKWENHRNAFFDVLYKIRKNGFYCDTTIACDGKFYKVNKIVLSTCSEYLHQMLESATVGSSSNSHPIIVLKDVRHQHLEALLDYMYIGEVNVLQSELACLIKAAEYLQIKGLAVPDDPINHYENREKRELETENKKDFTKRRKIGEEDKQSGEKNIELSGREENNVDREDNLENDSVSGSFEHSRYDVEKLKNNETLGLDQQGSNYTLPLSIHSSVDTYNEKKKTNEDINNSSYFNNHEETLSIKEAVINSPHSHVNENEYSPEFSNSNTINEEPQTTEIEDVPKEMILDPIQTIEDFSKNTCSLGSQEIGLRNILNPPENLIVNYTEDQTIHQQFNVLNNGAEFWPHFSQTAPQGVSCPYCLKLYYRKDAFLYHYKTHMGNKPYSCPYCNQSFIQKGSLKNHIKTHTGEKPFECPHCQRRFVQKTHLDNHVKIHTGEKPFPCPMCPKRFIQKVHMENHILTHTGEKPLSCPYCSQRFARKDILKDHISRRHPGHNL